jgi:hypothetical protein
MCSKMKEYNLACKMCVKHVCGPAVFTNGNKSTRPSFPKTHDSQLETVPSVVLLFLDFPRQ